MQQRNFFLTLLMAIAMMVFSPQIMRAAVESYCWRENVIELSSSLWQLLQEQYLADALHCR